MRTDTFQKIAEHDHTGSGKGTPLGAGSLLADSVTGAKFRLDNDEYLRARDFADSTNINILKINASDKLEITPEIGAVLKLSNNIAIQGRDFADTAELDLIKLTTSDLIEIGTQLASFVVANDNYIKARNNADSADINILKLNASDLVEIENVSVVTGSSATISGINSIASKTIQQNSSATLTDNTSVAADASIVTLSTDEAAVVEYRIVRNTDVQIGRIELDEDNASLIEEFYGDDAGITFSNNAGVLEYVSTSTGNNATITFIIIKK
jgi:hypothetical protein